MIGNTYMRLVCACAVLCWFLYVCVSADAGRHKKKLNCDGVTCPKIKCSKRLLVKDPHSCCPECYCKFKGKKIKPGTFCEKGRKCECNEGKITCLDPHCPLHTLDCVDYVEGEDCCYHCPNNRTCLVPGGTKTVVKQGEYKQVKNNVCICAGDPWYPYAFCAPKALAKALTKNYGDMLVEYMKL